MDLAENGKLESEEDIAFQIAPRINAAGRMETARLPVELLLCKDPDRAQEMAENRFTKHGAKKGAAINCRRSCRNGGNQEKE